MYILFIILLVYFIYYKYNTILTKELDTIENTTITDTFENYNIKNSYIKMNIPVNLNHYSIVSDEINTIPYYISHSLKFILGDDIKLKVVTKSKNELDKSNSDDVNSNNYNFAICTEFDLLKLANTQTTQSKQVPELENIRMICSLNKSYLFFIVHDNSNIKSLKDLVGKTMGINSSKSGTHSILNELCEILKLKMKDTSPFGNVDKDAVNFRTGGINELFNLFFKKQIECLFFVSGHNLPYIFSLTEKIPVRMLDINEPEFEIFNNTTPNDFFFLTRTRINIEPYDTFNSSRYLDTFYTRNVIICNSSIPTKTVYNITKNLFDNIGSVKSNIVTIGRRYFDETQDPLYDDFKKEYMVYSSNKLQLHQGAYLYFKEINMFINNDKICEFGDDKCNIYPYEKIKSYGEVFIN
jgi:TRAP transporter TAXI family solute receptor